jgi:hypothetical protein
MRTATREETRFIQRIILFFIFPLIVCIAATFYLSGRAENAQERIDDMKNTLAQSLKKYGTLPTFQKVNDEQELYKEMEKNFTVLKSVATVRPINAPDDVIEQGVYFKKQLFLTQKGLTELANKKEIEIPNTLGFGEALPSDNEVSLLLRKLETVGAAMRLLLDNNVKSVTVVKLLDDLTHKGESESKVLAREIAVRIDVNCTQASLMQVLNQAVNVKPFLVVRDISIKNFKEEILETSFIFARLVVEG